MKKKLIVFILITILILAAAVLNYLVEVYDMAQYKHLMRILKLAGVISVISGIIIFVLKKNISTIVFSFIFIISLLISSNMSSSIINNQRQVAFDTGTIISKALESFYKDNNYYPKDLNDLTPKYIDRVPKMNTPHGDVEYFSYSVIDEGKSYILGFEQYYFDGKGWIEEG